MGMLLDSDSDPANKIHLIDSLSRLGVSYHFENAIEEQLDHIFTSQFHAFAENNDYDLYTISVVFRVLRQHGFKMPTGEFQNVLQFYLSSSCFKPYDYHTNYNIMFYL